MYVFLKIKKIKTSNLILLIIFKVKTSFIFLETFPFQGNEKLLTFKTDSSVSGPGFFAHIQQEECDPRSLQSPDECSQDIRYCYHISLSKHKENLFLNKSNFVEELKKGFVKM